MPKRYSIHVGKQCCSECREGGKQEQKDIDATHSSPSSVLQTSDSLQSANFGHQTPMKCSQDGNQSTEQQELEAEKLRIHQGVPEQRNMNLRSRKAGLLFAPSSRVSTYVGISLFRPKVEKMSAERPLKTDDRQRKRSHRRAPPSTMTKTLQ